MEDILNMKSSIHGAIIGDIAGSRFEFRPHRDKDFELLYSFSGLGYTENQTVEDLFKSSHFTDDTVMTIAVANALIEARFNFENLRISRAPQGARERLEPEIQRW